VTAGGALVTSGKEGPGSGAAVLAGAAVNRPSASDIAATPVMVTRVRLVVPLER